MSATSKTERATLVAANGRARRPTEPPQGDLSHAESQRGGERRDLWFGNAPEGWSVGKMRSVVYERREKFSRNEELIILSLLKDVGVIPYSEKGEIGNKSKEDHSQYKVARKGDLVINSMNVIIGSVGISPYDGYISPAYYSFVPREDTCMGFIGYLCSTRRFQRAVRCYAKGIMEIRLRVSSYDFLSMPIPLPPLPEQKAIVAYLDAETGRIDKAIAAEEKMVALLQERREIVINEAVTPHDGWEMRPLRAFLRSVSVRNRPDEQLLSVTREAGVIVRDVSSKEENHNYIPDDLSNYKFVAKGQFVINKMKAWQGSYGVSPYDGIVSPAYFVYDLTFPCKVFFNLALRSKVYVPYFQRYSKGIRIDQWDLMPEALKVISFAYPPLPEQKAIVERLDRETGKIDRAIEVKRRQIELLRERRQIVIDEVVTGQVKVA